MAFFGKVFKYAASENFEDFLNSLGLPAEKAGTFMNFKPDQMIEQTGDTYVYTIHTPKGNKSLPFTSGVEFEDKVRDTTVKNLFTVNGHEVIHVVKFDSGLTITSKKEFSPTKLVEEVTNNKWDGVATVTYSI